MNTCKRKNKIIVLLAVIGLGLLFTIEGVIHPRIKAQEEQYNAAQKNPATHDLKSILPYKNKYMGNHINFIHLNNTLPLADIPKTYQLYPEELTANIHYKESVENLNEREIKRAILYNATASFVLIDNLQAVRYHFSDASYVIKRTSVEKWYGTTLTSLQNTGVWRRNVQSKISDDAYVTAFFSQHIQTSSS
ncbi:DUF4825 domain-containing protein [Aneurinibacillus sp. REN35]|uniref:DUF4825 domain-containing protein n=1 Tax=Aneurinibacillus sp. REN35 TaxID=3237286 RepID=UPI003528393B